MSSHEQASPEQIEHEIAVKRAEMNHTLDSIQRRFSGVHLVESLLGVTRGAARGARDAGSGLKDTSGAFAGNLGRTVRENPVPVALLGLGVGWLMLATRRGNGHANRDDEHTYDGGYGGTVSATGTGGYTAGTTPAGDRSTAEAASRIGSDVPARGGRLGEDTSDLARRGNQSVASQSESVSAVAERTRARAQSGAEDAKSRISETGSRAKQGLQSGAQAMSEARSRATHGLHSAGSTARHSMASAGEGARRYAGQARETTREYAAATRDFTVDAGRTIAHTAREHPLLVAAGLIMAGAAVAAALPRTRREDEWMGEYSDDARRAAKDAAGHAIDEARQAAGAVADATKQAAEREGMTAEGARRAATGTVESAGNVADAAGKAAKDEVDKRLSSSGTGGGERSKKDDSSG